ncbi:MAG: hypothetical protein M3377_03755, partial [Actinomycetota bacterium]|nr:hypothetical protein [Actinomycetota bacterium]
GPAGPQGPAGPVNVAVRTAAFTSVATVQISCNAGERALAGGWDYTGNIRVLTSQPVPNTADATPTGWKVVLRAAASGSIYVVCAS